MLKNFVQQNVLKCRGEYAGKLPNVVQWSCICQIVLMNMKHTECTNHPNSTYNLIDIIQLIVLMTTASWYTSYIKIILTVVCHAVPLYAKLFAGTDFQNVKGHQWQDYPARPTELPVTSYIMYICSIPCLYACQCTWPCCHM